MLNVFKGLFPVLVFPVPRDVTKDLKESKQKIMAWYGFSQCKRENGKEEYVA